MRTLDEIRGRCVIDDEGHWLWQGALNARGRPSIHAPDFTLGGMRTQAGPRAVWHIKTGKAIPAGWRVFGTCDDPLCLNPRCMGCASSADLGARIAASGIYKGQAARILANRAINRARSLVDAALIAEIQASPETGVAVAQRLDLDPRLVSKARRGELRSFASAGPFAGLVPL